MPTASRLHRRPWGDLRFLVGVLLIIAAVAGVWLVVSAAGRTAPTLQATRTIVPGEVLSSADVRVVDIALGAAGDGYLGPAQLTSGMIATRTISGGELIASSATAAADSGRTTSVVIDSAVGVPASVKTGTVVEIWAATAAKETKTAAPPVVLLPSATVASVHHDDAILGGSKVTVELVIDRDDVADLLGALSQGATLSVVPTRSGS